MAVICGRNDKLRARLDNASFGENVQVKAYGFVTNMHEFMAASDAIITKAGAQSSASACFHNIEEHWRHGAASVPHGLVATVCGSRSLIAFTWRQSTPGSQHRLAHKTANFTAFENGMLHHAANLGQLWHHQQVGVFVMQGRVQLQKRSSAACQSCSTATCHAKKRATYPTSSTTAAAHSSATLQRLPTSLTSGLHQRARSCFRCALPQGTLASRDTKRFLSASETLCHLASQPLWPTCSACTVVGADPGKADVSFARRRLLVHVRVQRMGSKSCSVQKRFCPGSSDGLGQWVGWQRFWHTYHAARFEI